MRLNKEVRLNIEEIRNMIRALEAMEGESGIAGILITLCMTLPEKWRSEWNSVFQILGEKYTGLLRFDIIHGVLAALKECDAMVWAKVWMKAIPAANIHPISLVLCADHGGSFKHLFDSFMEANSRHHWFAKVKCESFLSTLEGCEWYLQPSKPRAIHSLLSSKTVYFSTAENSRVIRIGHDWAVYSLRVKGSHPEIAMKVYIHEDLTVFGILDLFLIGKVARIRPRMRVGRCFHIPTQNEDSDQVFSRCLLQQGVRIQGRNLVCGDGCIQWPKEPFSDPIEAPMSFFALHIGTWPGW